MKTIANYFGLGVYPEELLLGSRTGKRSPQQRKVRRSKIKWIAALYVALLIGILCSFLLMPFNPKEPHLHAINTDKFIVAIVLAIVVFPMIFKGAKFSKLSPPGAMHLFISFQEGFFWSAVIKGVHLFL